MKRNFDTELKTLSGKPFMDDSQPPKPATAKFIAMTALLAAYSDEQNLSGAEKFKRFKLAERVNAGGVIDLTSEELASLKELVGKAFSAELVGRMYEILDTDFTD